jgi:hypothetical protein
VAWYRVDPRYLRQADPDGLTLAYVSHGELDTGHLVLHLDRLRDVAGFELAYDRFLSRCELFAEWDRIAGLRLGEVDTHGRTDTLGPRPRMSPIVRHHRRAPAADVDMLLGYVQRSAEILAPHHRQAVIAILRDALHDAVDDSDGGNGRNTA